MTRLQSSTTLDSQFRADVLDGLARPQKELPPKYFYDEAGSRLFNQITELPEYYPTRTELGIMAEHAEAMAKRCGRDCLLIEFGAGSMEKTRLLLNQLDQPAAFVPVDVSGDYLGEAAESLAADYPDLQIIPAVADFTESLSLPDIPASRLVVYFPGSTLGNFDPTEAKSLLRRIAWQVGPGGGLLLGVDLRKEESVLERAYNDEAGVTAAFNLNLLARANRELGADFDLDAFGHLAFYNREQSRIEMHLVSLTEQEAQVDSTTFAFRKGETIHTENSYKFEVAELADQASQCGWRLDESWTDAKQYFAMLYFTAL